MRVALIGPFVAPIDEDAAQLGGAQAVVADLARGLAARGHAVTLFAPRGSRVRGVAIEDVGLAADPGAALGPTASAPVARPQPAFARVAARLAADGPWDVVHAHAFDAPAFAALRGPRLVHTLHLPPIDAAIVAAVRDAAGRLATVSASCRAAWAAAGVTVAALLPNGVDLAAVPAGPGGRGLAFAGRISPEKDPAAACRIARALDLPLVLAGPVYDPAYHAREVAPLLGGRIRHVGPLDRRALWRLLGSAAVTVLPVRWDEPFGMVALESLGCGTPVAAYDRGGLGEIVADGRTGRLAPADDEDALRGAVRDALGLRRGDARAGAARFDLAAMLDAHEALYRTLDG